MTERFTLTNPKNAFQEMKCGIDDRGNTLTFNEVVDMLNAFNDENEQLKHRIKKLQNELDNYSEIFNELNALVDENEQLKSEIEKLSYANEDLLEEKRIWKQMSDEYTKLSDENEKLKSICQDHRDHAIDFKADCVRLEKENEQLKQENEWLKSEIQKLYNFVKIDVDHNIEVYPKSLMEPILEILKIIGDVE